jgi:hypothetical protein
MFSFVVVLAVGMLDDCRCSVTVITLRGRCRQRLCLVRVDAGNSAEAPVAERSTGKTSARARFRRRCVLVRRTIWLGRDGYGQLIERPGDTGASPGRVNPASQPCSVFIRIRNQEVVSLAP